jgi:hypothetical protein
MGSDISNWLLAGQTSAVWLRVQDELSRVTKACVYDRAGLALSDPAPRLNLSDPGKTFLLSSLLQK